MEGKLPFTVECTDQSFRPGHHTPVLLQRAWVEEGNLEAVHQECWRTFFPNAHTRAPFFLFCANSDVPLTQHTLRSWLLGEDVYPPPRHPSSNLPHLRYGPTPTSGHTSVEPQCVTVHCPPHPWILETILSPGEQGGATCRLYQCEPADNSIESLLTAHRRGQVVLEMHTYVLPLQWLGVQGAEKNYICHYDNGVGILQDETAIKRALTLRENTRPGQLVLNNGSPIFFIDGSFSRFGIGFKNSEFHRGRCLSLMTRHVESKTIMENTESLEGMVSSRDQLTQAAPSGDDGWKQLCVFREPHHRHAQTARKRRQEWEARDPKLPAIVDEVSTKNNFFLQITSDLQEVAIKQLLEEKGLCLAKDMRHTYFYLTSHSCLFKNPPRNPDRAPFARIKWQLHIASSRKQGAGDVDMEEFRVDKAPWHGWPDVPEGQSLEILQRREDPSFRLLRFTMHYGTLQEPLCLPRTGMHVQDGLVFGFSHTKLRAEGQEELPIHTVVLRYLPDAGFGNLKENLGLADSKRVLDVYFKGRLVPLADVIQDLDILTEALMRAKNKNYKSRGPMEAIVQSKFVGQCFLQGANIPSLVDHIKVRLGLTLPLSNKTLKNMGKEGLQLYAVDVIDDKQYYRPCSHEDLVSDYAYAYLHLEKNLERTFELHSRLSPAQFGSQKWWREGNLFFGELHKKDKANNKQIIRLGKDVSAQLSPGDAFHLFLGEGSTKHSTVLGSVVAFKVSLDNVADRDSNASCYVGPYASAILQIQPQNLFDGKLIREVPITECEESRRNSRTVTDIANQAPRQIEVHLMDRRKLSDVLEVSAESKELVLAVFIKNARNQALTTWINPEAAPGSNTRTLFRGLKVRQEITSQGQQKTEQEAGQFSTTELSLWGYEGYKFVIPASVLGHCGKKKVRHTLRHEFLSLPAVEHTITVVAGKLHKLDVGSVSCTLGQHIDIPVTGKDVRGNPTQLHELQGDAVSISLRTPAELYLEVHDVKRVCEEEFVVQARVLLSQRAPNLFGSGQDVDSLCAEGALTFGSVSGSLKITVTPGPPVALHFSPPLAALTLENGERLPSIKLTATDEHGCYTRLPEDWHPNLTIVGFHTNPGVVFEYPCTARGAEITTPAGLVDVGTELDRPLELQASAILSTSNAEERVKSPALWLCLQPSNKPRKVLLRLTGHTVQPLAAAEVDGHLQRANRSGIAGQIQGPPAGVPVYLIKYPNPSLNEACDVRGLHLDVQGDGDRVLEEVFVAVEPKPPRIRNALDDNGDFAFLKTPALQEDQQYSCYKVTCSSVGGHHQARASLSFLILVAAVPPAPVMWQWQLSSQQDLGFSLHSSTDEDDSARTQLPLAQPLAHMLTPQTVDAQLVAREAAAGTLPMVSILPSQRSSSGDAVGKEAEGGLDVQLARTEHSLGSTSRGTSAQASSLLPIGCGPLEFSDDLCLVGKANNGCSLQLSGGDLQPGLLEVTVVGGFPEDFALHGPSGNEFLLPPGVPDTTPTIPCASHEELGQRLHLVLRDFAGHPATIPDAWRSAHIILKVRREPDSTAELTPQGGLQLKLSNHACCRLISNFVLHLPIPRLAPGPFPIPASYHLSASLPRQGRSRSQQLLQSTKSVILETSPSDNIVALLDLHEAFDTSGSQLVAGNEWPELLAWVSLRTEAGSRVGEAELEEVASGIRGSLHFPDGQRLDLACRRAERSSGVPQLALEWPRAVDGPLQKSGRYSVTAEYVEQRPAQASILQGSASSRINASSHLSFEVRSGAPVSMHLLNPEQEVAGWNAANLNESGTLLAQSMQVQLMDQFSNQAIPPPGMALRASVERQQGSQQQQQGQEQQQEPQQLPLLAQHPGLSSDAQGHLLLGPVQLTERSGQGLGSCVLELVLFLSWAPNNVISKRIPFTFYDTAGVGAAQVELDRLTDEQHRAAAELERLQAQRRTRLQEATNQGRSCDEVWASARSLLQQNQSQQLLQQAGLTAALTQAVQSSDWQGTQQVLASLEQQLNSAQPPRYHGPAQVARQIVEGFKGLHRQYAQEVLGLSLDLLVSSDEHARRLASWLVGRQVVIIVRSARAQSAMLSYLRALHPTQRPQTRTHVLPLDMLDRFHLLGQPPLTPQFPSAVYLSSCFKVKQEVPATDDMHMRLLYALLSNVIMLPSLAAAQDYRQRVVRQNGRCPELVTHDGQCVSSQGSVTVSQNDMDDVAPSSIDQLPAAFGSCPDDASIQLQQRIRQIAAQLGSLPDISGRQARAQQNAASTLTRMQETQQRLQELGEQLQERQAQREHIASTPQRPQNLPSSPASSTAKRRHDDDTAGPSKHLRFCNSGSSSRRS